MRNILQVKQGVKRLAKNDDLNLMLTARVVKLKAELDIEGSMKTLKKNVDTITERLADNPVELKVALKPTEKELNEEIKKLSTRLKDNRIPIKVNLVTTVKDINNDISAINKAVKTSKSFKPLKLSVEIDVKGSAEVIKGQLNEIYKTVQDFNKRYGDQLKHMQAKNLQAQRSATNMSRVNTENVNIVPSQATKVENFNNIKDYAKTLKEAERILKSKLKDTETGLFGSKELKDAKGNLLGFIATLEKANGVVEQARYKWDDAKKQFSIVDRETVTQTEKMVHKSVQALNDLEKELRKTGREADKFNDEFNKLAQKGLDGTLTMDNVRAFKTQLDKQKEMVQAEQKENNVLAEQKKLIYEITKARDEEFKKTTDMQRRLQFNGLIKNVQTDPENLKHYRLEMQKLIDVEKKRVQAEKENINVAKQREDIARRLRQLDSNISPVNLDAKNLIAQTTQLNNMARSAEDMIKVNRKLAEIADAKWMIDYSRKAADMEQKVGNTLKKLVESGDMNVKSYQRIMSVLPDVTEGNLGELERILRKYNTRLDKVMSNNFANRGTLIDDTKGFDAKSIFSDRDIKQTNEMMKAIYGAELATVGFRDVEKGARGVVQEMTVTFKSKTKEARKMVVELDKVTNQMRVLRDELTHNPNRNLGFFEQLKIAMERVPTWMVAMTAFYGTIESVRAMTREILEVDKAMTELRRVASASINLDTVFEGAVDIAKELGNNVHDVIQSVNDLARTFGDFNERQLLDITKTATLMANVSDLNAEEATKSLVGTMNAFNIAAGDSIRIVDALNEVDNNYAISTKQLAEGLEKSSSTAKTFGVTLEENIGAITAIGAVTMESGSIIGKIIAA